jgi:hypothetical protein
MFEAEPVKYLVPASVTDSVRKLLKRDPDVGLILTPAQGRPTLLEDAHVWAADNGCYAEGEHFNPSTWLRWLEGFSPEERTRCLFATLPDVVGDARATMARSEGWVGRVRSLGYRIAIVAQNGLEDFRQIPWGWIDCLFVGGTTDWKLSEPSYAIAREARRLGKWVHMGRVNSYRRIIAARNSGFDSVDGTYVVFGPDRNSERLGAWMEKLRTLPAFPNEEMWGERI